MISEPTAEAVCATCGHGKHHHLTRDSDGSQFCAACVMGNAGDEFHPFKPREEPERESETIEKVRLGLRSTPPLQEIAVADAVAAAREAYTCWLVESWKMSVTSAEYYAQLGGVVGEEFYAGFAAAQAEAPRIAEPEAALRERDAAWHEAVTRSFNPIAAEQVAELARALAPSAEKEGGEACAGDTE